MDNPPEDGPCEVTITAPDHDALQEFARGLVESHLAAAAHLDEMRTTYRWHDVVEGGEEGRARIHTDFRVLHEIESAVAEWHQYEVACVVATAIAGGSPDYLQWIEDSVRLRARPGAASE